MYRLAHDERAYIRPSPSSGVLGGLAQYTHDVIQLCQVRFEGQSLLSSRSLTGYLRLGLPRDFVCGVFWCGVMQCAGYETVIVETVGLGQSETLIDQTVRQPDVPRLPPAAKQCCPLPAECHACAAYGNMTNDRASLTHLIGRSCDSRPAPGRGR